MLRDVAMGLPTWMEGTIAWALFCGWLALCLGGIDWSIRYVLGRLEDG